MSSLSVKVINKQTDTIINDEYPNILLDDSIKKIKEKLFVFFPELIPNLIKVEIKNNNNEFITITDSNSILYEAFEIIPKEPIIFISNLQDTISNVDLQNLYINENEFKDYFEKLKKEYSDLTEDDLSFIVKLKLLNLGLGNITISDIQDYITSNQTKRNKLIDLIEKLENDKTLQQFYKLSKNFTPEINKITYNDINLIVTGENVISGTKGVFIKLNEIFNILELNDKIPFIALGKKSSESDTKQPQIKIYNRLLDNVSDKEIKSWVLNEKKKLNEATYKIVKGLMIKSKFKNTNNYLTINILSNGILYVNLKISDNDLENLEETIEDIKQNVNSVIDYINLLKTVFLKSKRIVSLDKSKIVIDSIDTTIETGIFINRNKFESLIKQDLISKNILEFKKTESLDVLSAYYKKFKTRESTEDIKGITINIRDNPYKEDSSIIKIFGANNQNQATIIAWNILILHEMSELIKKNGLFEDFTKKRKIREKTNKKKLKEQGIHFDSRECQAIRQPKLNPDNKPPLKKDGYTITFNNQNYRCDNVNYPYPGFTKSNIVCCFKYNQTGNESYIKNVDPESLNILVEPSNFKIKIKKQDKTSFETYVIKIVSDYKPGFNEQNSMPRYYYLSNTTNKLTSDNDIIPIYNKELIDAIEQEDNIWLDRVTLSQLIYPSASNKCSFKPDLNNRVSIHSPCDEHKTNKYFGYTSKSIPCCFDKEREPYVSRKKKEADITKQYIIQSSDKILNYKQLGILPQDISILLENILEIKDTHYRMGIIQNNSSFLNALLLAVNNNIRGVDINNHNEFKTFIENYLNKNIKEFNKLNNGDISIKYSNIQSYINYINNADIFLNWLELIDLLERILKRNIIIIDTTESTRMLCRPIILNPKKYGRPFLILLKKKNTFEVIVRLITQDKKNEIIKEYDYSDKLVKFLTEYYTNTCIRKNVYPENYSFIPIYPHQVIINNLKNQITNNNFIGNIKYQVINDFNKVNMLMTKRGILIPILETGIIDNPEIKVVSFSSIIRQKDKLLSLKDYINAFKAFNQVMKTVKDFKRVKILGLVDSNIDTIGGIVTNFNYIIPYKKDEKDKKYSFEIFDYKYYLDIDTKLNTPQIDSKFNQYNMKTDSLYNSIFNLKKIIGDKINGNIEIKEYIEKLLKRPDISKGDKIIDLIDIFDTLKIKTDDNITLLKAIANEILNDNKEKLILNNIITSDTFNKNDVIIRESESILLNIDDIRKWIKKHQILV